MADETTPAVDAPAAEAAPAPVSDFHESKLHADLRAYIDSHGGNAIGRLHQMADELVDLFKQYFV